MIIFLPGFKASHEHNHDIILQLQFIDSDVQFVHYSTVHPRHDMSHLLKEVQRLVTHSQDSAPLICGVGLGAYWSERIGFLCGIQQVLINPNLSPEQTMIGKIDRPEEYADIATKCVSEFRRKNSGQALCLLSRHDEVRDSQASAALLSPYYSLIWDDAEPHAFTHLARHLSDIKAFKLASRHAPQCETRAPS
ncbi:MAG: alpha/beta hydrolase YcfP [Aeromonas sp.]